MAYSVVDFCVQIFSTSKPPPELTVSEWANKHRVLSPEASVEPGQWINERAKYQVGIMDAVNDPAVEYLVVMSSAQIGKTEILNNIIAYFIDQDPSPLMVIQPTLDMAETWSRDRFMPMVRDTKKLYGKIKALSHDSENRILHKIFPGGNLTISGANSPASLAARPKRVVIGDDVDRFPISAGNEGDPVNLMFKRTAAFWNRKKILFSTPTNQGSRILKEFENSDKRYYFVPCPKCGNFQTLKWKDKASGKYFVKWEKDKKNKYTEGSAYYECAFCQAKLYDADILWMIRNGEWRATAPFTGRAGFYINELYSPFVPLNETVKDFYEAKNDPERLKVWINTSLGEIFVERGDAPAWERLFMNKEKYPIGAVPDGGLLLVAGADVQQDRVEVEVVAYGRGKESWSVAEIIFSGQTAEGKTFEMLDDLMAQEFQHNNGGFLKIKMIAIDAGYETQAVYNWARKYPINRAMAIRGQDSLGTILGIPKNVDILINNKKHKRGFKYWPIGVSVLKSELYGFLRLEKKIDKTYPQGYCHFPEYEEEFFKQLTSESLHIVDSNRTKKFYWKKDRERNEALDRRNYARAAAQALGIEMFSQQTWERLEAETLPVESQKKIINEFTKKKKKKIISKGIKLD